MATLEKLLEWVLDVSVNYEDRNLYSVSLDRDINITNTW